MRTHRLTAVFESFWLWIGVQIAQTDMVWINLTNGHVRHGKPVKFSFQLHSFVKYGIFVKYLYNTHICIIYI